MLLTHHYDATLSGAVLLCTLNSISAAAKGKIAGALITEFSSKVRAPFTIGSGCSSRWQVG
mgnify:CR=1 FL=1